MCVCVCVCVLLFVGFVFFVLFWFGLRVCLFVCSFVVVVIILFSLFFFFFCLFFGWVMLFVFVGFFANGADPRLLKGSIVSLNIAKQK